MPVNSQRRLPNTNSTLGLLYILRLTSANTWHLPNTVSLLTLRRWPNIKKALGDCPVLLGLRHCYVRVTLNFFPGRQKDHIPDNAINWPNADVMLDHRL